MEYHSGAIFHTSDSLLERLASAQRGFLQEIDVSPEFAFLEHNFAQTKLRRHSGMLRFLHKRVLGKSHPAIQRLFPFHADVFGSLRPGDMTSNCMSYFGSAATAISASSFRVWHGSDL